MSESFAKLPGSTSPLELVVTAYNINPGHNEDIVRKDENLHGYVTFVSKARTYEQSGMEFTKAVERAIKECIDEDILKEFLEDNASEVFNMLVQEWDWDKYWETVARNSKEEESQKWQAALAGKDAALAGKDAALAEQAAEIAALKALLESGAKPKQ